MPPVQSNDFIQSLSQIVDEQDTNFYPPSKAYKGNNINE